MKSFNKNLINIKTQQIEFYKNLLNGSCGDFKDNENEQIEKILLLKSKDAYFKNHYLLSPLNILSGFSGSAAEAVIDQNGKITIFVDPRYHKLVDIQVFKDIEIVKMPLNTTFFEMLKRKYKKDTMLFVADDIDLKEYFLYDSYFDLRKYKLPKKYLKNKDFNKNAKIFEVDKEIEKRDFNFKINELKSFVENKSRVLISDLDVISYYTNLRSFQTKFSSNFRSLLLLDFKTKKNILFVDDTKLLGNIKIENLEFRELEEFKNIILSFNNSKDDNDGILIDKNNITLDKFIAIKNPQPLKENLNLIASIKPVSVIEDNLKDNKRVDIALLNFKNKLKKGLSETELVNIFEKELLKAGAKCTSFKTILAIQENSASIHYSSYDKNKLLQEENLLLLDCGGYFENGFATDITRTFYFGSNPKPIYKKVYTYVLKAFIACFLSNNTQASILDKTARDILKPLEDNKNENIGFYFNHGLGHGISTSVHQNPPLLSLNSKDTIKPYQTHSIEPGAYGKDDEGNEFGVRIENCVYFDLNFKRHSLSHYPFEEILIDYNILDDNEKDFISKWQTTFKTYNT